MSPLPSNATTPIVPAVRSATPAFPSISGNNSPSVAWSAGSLTCMATTRAVASPDVAASACNTSSTSSPDVPGRLAFAATVKASSVTSTADPAASRVMPVNELESNAPTKSAPVP